MERDIKTLSHQTSMPLAKWWVMTKQKSTFFSLNYISASAPINVISDLIFMAWLFIDVSLLPLHIGIYCVRMHAAQCILLNSITQLCDYKFWFIGYQLRAHIGKVYYRAFDNNLWCAHLLLADVCEHLRT